MRPHPRLHAYAMAMAIATVLGILAQGCGVLSSSLDCAERSNCPLLDAADEPVLSGDVMIGDAGTGDDQGADEQAVDGRAEPAPPPDVDGGATDATAQDAVSEPGEDVVGDACIDGGPENCNDGIDDNCDGKIDCADPQCGAYACAPPAPTGWIGPALLWTGAFGATPPVCPPGYQDALDESAGPTGTADTCTCACTATGQVCSATGTLMSQSACQAASACRTVTVSSGGACSAATTSMACGSAGSFSVSVPTPTGGSCIPQATTTVGSIATFTTSARVCARVGPIDTPGGCATASAQCVRAPTTGFASTLCVYQSGAVACPPAYPNSHVLYSGKSDTRACSSCTCGASPSGGTCSGTIALYGNLAAGCSGPSATYTLGMPGCFSYNGLANSPGFASASFAVSPGTCPVTAQSQPTGAVTGSGPTTVCCM